MNRKMGLKMHLHEVVCENVKLTEMAQDRGPVVRLCDDEPLYLTVV
jgi:hypothetical protein